MYNDETEITIYVTETVMLTCQYTDSTRTHGQTAFLANEQDVSQESTIENVQLLLRIEYGERFWLMKECLMSPIEN